MEDVPIPGKCVIHPTLGNGVVLIEDDVALVPKAGCVPVLFQGPPTSTLWVPWSQLVVDPLPNNPHDVGAPSILGEMLEQMQVEDIGRYMIFQYDDAEWEAVVSRIDGESFDFDRTFNTAGEALNFLYAWAFARGLILTTVDGQVRRYKPQKG